MSRRDPPTFCCDSPGCKSTCTLSPAEPAADKALAARGWLVVSAGDKETHYCPGCKSKQAAAAKSQ